MSLHAPKLVVNACLTGMVPTKADNPAVPVTPDEIAADAERVTRAGAAIVHLHARDGRATPAEARDLIGLPGR